ncbi:hypothetical protein [Mucilaginibacter ginkgonis]|uniref:DUF3352 domain-containing protein n=1 Tax=Mucilaginibacter ginkgonis TaxID=2682091 RepID=A0A7T7JHJ4_9SPHI|nr:hypothetical protein [Mucilaginibacter ginkgonis]QQL50618.1 hypothetical protein GO620_003945 [Mucilaginibacter ginkgonis]
MKHMLIAIALLIITAVVTIFYFRSISQANLKPADLLKHVPGDAALVLEYNNDDSFYEAFNDNNLFASILGPIKTREFALLKKALMQNAVFKSYFKNRPFYVSVHPLTGEQIDVLITTTAANPGKEKLYKNAAILNDPNFKANVSYPGYTKLLKLDIAGMGRSFFISESDDHVFSASFSLPLLRIAAEYDIKNQRNDFYQVPDQQHANAFGLLYINYAQLKPLVAQVFSGSNPELLKSFKSLAAQAALSFNYRKDALMFNGLTAIDAKKPASYLNLFAAQQPLDNSLKDIFPATTAYSTSFSVSDPQRFITDLAQWIGKSGLHKSSVELFEKIKAETGVNIDHEINKQLGAEFATLTTRFQERYAIVDVKNGAQILPPLINISTMRDDGIGQFNYEKIPFFLFGDAFSNFNKPYFTIVNNYLILANTPGELHSFIESYNNQKFLSKTETFNSFDNLLSEKSNVSFYLNFKNASHVFQRDMKPGFYSAYNNAEPGLKNFYGLSFQLSASDNNFYTNLCLYQPVSDTSSVKNNN